MSTTQILLESDRRKLTIEHLNEYQKGMAAGTARSAVVTTMLLMGAQMMYRSGTGVWYKAALPANGLCDYDLFNPTIAAEYPYTLECVHEGNTGAGSLVVFVGVTAEMMAVTQGTNPGSGIQRGEVFVINDLVRKGDHMLLRLDSGSNAINKALFPTAAFRVFPTHMSVKIRDMASRDNILLQHAAETVLHQTAAGA